MLVKFYPQMIVDL